MEKTSSHNSGFSSKIGYILAAAGSAVGLGNIWRFPYLAAKYGGGIFLVTYLVLVLTFGYTLLIAENCLGRITGKGPIGTYKDICKNEKGFLKHLQIGGWINALVPLIIVPYYCVIGGWVTKYIFAMLCNPISNFAKTATVAKTLSNGTVESVNASTHYFTSFISNPVQSTGFFLLFAAILAVVAAFGVEKGVERFNKILMPALVIMLIGICIYCLFLPGAKEGFIYYLKPNPAKFSYMTIVQAMGQLFFSLSIAMGIMITYGSYMRKEDDLVSNVNHVQIFDTGVAFLAGLMIIPAVVAFGGPQAAESAGPGLVFITMPQVFASFPCGRIVGVAFFILVLFAAATSAISLLETNIQTISQEMKISRMKSLVICILEILTIGIITNLGYSILSNVCLLPGKDILDTLDYISNYVMMPIGAIFTTVLVTAVFGLKKFGDEVQQNFPWYRRYVFELCMSVVVIPCLLIVLLNATGVIK